MSILSTVSARGLTATGSGFADAVERRVGLTPSGLVVCVLAVGLFAGARLVGSQSLFMLTYGALAVVGLAYVLARRRLSVRTERSELPTRVRQGQSVTV